MSDNHKVTRVHENLLDGLIILRKRINFDGEISNLQLENIVGEMIKKSKGRIKVIPKKNEFIIDWDWRF